MTEPITIGAYLRDGRRKRRVSIERAAEETRIRADFLMRMESDEFDFLAPPYVRGFLRSYANFLRVDPQPLVEEFDRRYARSRLDTDQIVALDRRRRSNAPRERRRPNSWTVGAFLAAATLVALAIIGMVSNNDHRPNTNNNVALNSPAASTSPTVTSTPSLTPTPTPRPTEISFTNGIHLKVVASRGRCWVQAMADGNDAVPIFSSTLEIGQSQMLKATHSLKVLLGFPEGVDLILNGHNIGYHGPPGATTIVLPQDLKSLT